ncbi:DUF6291 domain-containing protein [Riemerella anatipestifer]|uniref:DUF6291 domain-containing protein n=1 Tax=Riemerella anatipestifer TaxID=34085 RepID=UPI001C88E217|nr:DUF6291 domain-containing protein [Riemerella anatipestifer]
MQRESFVFYESWYEILRDERQEVQWEVIRAIMEYVFNNNLIELKPNAKMAFKFIKRDIDRANDKYEEYLEKQRENGKRGGRPKKPTETQKTQAFFEKPTETQKSLNVNVNVNENVNVNDNNVLLEKEPKGFLSDLEEEGKAKLNNDIDFEKLLNFISDKTKRKFKTINDQIKRKYKARLKEGYTKEDILEAIENAVKDKYHMEQGYKYLTPEFFSRPVTLDKYKNTTSQKATEKKKTYGIWSV